MIRIIRIRLLPTKEQEELMFESVGCARFVYNWALEKCNEYYELNKIHDFDLIRRELTQLKKQPEYLWLNNVSNSTLVESIRNLDRGFKSFFKGNSARPKFKTKRKSKKSFYVRHNRLSFTDNTCHIEKIGNVRYTTNYTIPNDVYHNPYCVYDGKYWYLSFGIDIEENQTILNQNLSIGIDLGVKELATISCLDKPIENINKTITVKKLKKRLKRLRRKVSRKYRMNKQGSQYVKTNNIVKLEKEILLIYRKLNNIRNNHVHQTTNMIVKLKPYRVVMEDLNIKGLMKNKYLAEAIQEQCMSDFIRKMRYKCENNGIQFVQADRFYPSSKTCSCCRYVKPKLSLKERIYKCDNCGLIIDRDKNASINLANYGLV